MNNETTTTTAPESKPERKFRLPMVSKKTLIITLLVIAVLAAGYYYKSLVIAAMVDGKPISRFAVIKELERQSGRQALDNLINEKLILSEAEKQKVSVSKEELDQKIKELEDQFAAQGTTLQSALEAEGVTMDSLRNQIELQKMAEKMLSEKIKVSDEEVNKYITENQVTFDAGEEAKQKDQLKEQLVQQKFGMEIATWLADLKKQASVKEFVIY